MSANMFNRQAVFIKKMINKLKETQINEHQTRTNTSNTA